MPKIFPTLAAPAKSTGAAAGEPSRGRAARRLPSDDRAGFDQALRGARKREAANAAAEPERRAAQATGRADARKATKARERAEASDADERPLRDAAEPPATDEAAVPPATDADPDRPDASPGGAEAEEQPAARPTGRAAPAAKPVRPGVPAAEESTAAPEENGGPDPLNGVELPALDDESALPVGAGLGLTEAQVGGEDDAESEGAAATQSPPADSLAVLPNALTPADQAASAFADGGVLEDMTAGDATASGTARVPVLSSVAGHASGAVPAAATAGATAAKGPMSPENRPKVTAAEPATQGTAAEVVEALDPTTSSTAEAPVASGATSAAATPVSTTPGLSPETVAGMVADAAPKPQHASAPASATLPPVPPEARFAADNHANIVAGMRGQLMPDGGTMHIRLDPPQLGPLAVTVRLRGGVMEASFEAATDEAAKLLSHSLGALKTSLESHGVNVERLHVTQAPKDPQATQQQQEGSRDQQQQGQQGRDLQQEQSARQEQQRREMLRRMWRKLSGIDDPLDMVA